MEIREENGNIILTGVTEKSEVGTSDLIDREFNSSKNINGEYIGVVVGSSVAGEGITLKHVQQCHIGSPYWNNLVTEQAIARTIRLGFHEGIDNAEIKVFRHCAIADDNYETEPFDRFIII